VAIVAIYLSGLRAKKEKAPEKVIDKNAYLLALGGEENVVSKKLMGSRIVLGLKRLSKNRPSQTQGSRGRFLY
jgi:hypothetical protein